MNENNEKNVNVVDIDKTLLLVKGVCKDKEYIKKLGNAIVECFYKNDKVKLRYVGAGAGNNTDKSFIVARTKIFEESGDVLAYIPEFTTVYIKEQERTGIIKKSVNVKDMLEEDQDYDFDIKEDNLLLIKGGSEDKRENREYVKKLSNAILQVFYKHSKVNLRCVGAGAINNADKALIIARGEAFKQGDVLVCIPEFTTVKFEGKEKTGIVKCVFNIRDLKK